METMNMEQRDPESASKSVEFAAGVMFAANEVFGAIGAGHDLHHVERLITELHDRAQMVLRESFG